LGKSHDEGFRRVEKGFGEGSAERLLGVGRQFKAFTIPASAVAGLAWFT